jgi:hypothetical protein
LCHARGVLSMKRRSRRAYLSALFWLFLVLLLGWAVYPKWRDIIAPALAHTRWYDHVRASLASLRLRRSPDVSQKQWQYVVGWTLNAHANCCAIREAVDLDAREEFSKQLDQKLAGTVDMGTIDWIWDELEKISRLGSHYSERFRPTIPRNLRDAEFWSWPDLEVP